jgi:GNAT superfamily N-acetyltransferase
MAVIDQFRPEDRLALTALYRRVFGNDAADGWQLRWDWQVRRNPCTPPGGPLIWVAREGPALVGHCAAMPVRLAVLGEEVDGSWGIDVMVAPERRRQAIGQRLVATWDASVDAALALGPTRSATALFEGLGWPKPIGIPTFVKPLTRRALRRGEWSPAVNRLVSAVTLPMVKVVARSRPIDGEIEIVRRFDAALTRLWDRVAPKFDLAVRRDAPYLTWKYLKPPHVRYSAIVLRREGEVAGYAVYRHVQEARTRATLLVDFLADPDDRPALQALLRFVDREARAADSDKIRGCCLHRGFGAVLKRSGYFQMKPTLELVAKPNVPGLPARFQDRPGRWHVTLGDADADR